MMRHLGPEGWGVISYALSLTAILSVLLDLGLNTLITREIARDRSVTGKYAGNILVLKLLLAVSLFVVVAITVNFIGYSVDVTTVIELILLSIIFTSISQFFYNILQANGIMEYQAIGSIMTSLLMLAAPCLPSRKLIMSWGLLLSTRNEPDMLIYSTAVCVMKVGLPRLEVDLHFWRLTLWESVPYGLGGFFGTIYYYIDSVMLYPMQGEAAVGWYNTAYRLFMYVLFIPQILSTTLFPVMARLSASSKSSVKFAYEKFFNIWRCSGYLLALARLYGGKKKLSTYSLDPDMRTLLLRSRFGYGPPYFIFFSIPFGCLFNSTEHAAYRYEDRFPFVPYSRGFQLKL
jgi:O-antigen/teichoic acid export membrane protein